MSIISQHVHLYHFNVQTKSFDGFTRILIKITDKNEIFLNCRQATITQVLINGKSYEDLEMVDLMEGLFHRKDTRMDGQLVKKYRSFSIFCTSGGRGEITIKLPELSNPLVEIDIYYRIENPKTGVYFCSTGFFICSIGHRTRDWLPCIENQRALWALDFTLPDYMDTVMASGQCTYREDNVKRFVSICPVYPSSIGFAIGNFKKHVYSNEDAIQPLIQSLTISPFERNLPFTIKLIPERIYIMLELLACDYPINTLTIVFLPRVETYEYLGFLIIDTAQLLDSTMIEQWWPTHYSMMKCAAAQIFGCIHNCKDPHDKWIIVGLHEWLFANFVAELGNNEYRYHVHKAMKTVLEYGKRIKLATCGRIGCCNVDEAVCTDAEVFKCKAFLVIRSVECRVGREKFINGIKKIILKSQTEGQLDISSESFYHLIGECVTMDVKQIVESSSGLYEFYVKYLYNRRKSTIELEVKQRQYHSIDIPVVKIHGVCEVQQDIGVFPHLNNSISSSSHQCMFTECDFYRGPLTVAIQEWDGYFLHTIQVDEGLCRIEVPCGSRLAKRNRKRRIVLQNEEEINLDLAEGESENPIVFIRIDPEYALSQRRICIEGIHWSDQLQYGRDVLAQFESLDVLACDNMSCTIIENLLLTNKTFYKVLMSCCDVMARWTHDQLDLYKLYDKIFISDSPNDFTKLEMYMLRLSLIRSIRWARPPENSQECASLITSLISLYVYNDNSINPYSDDYFRANLLRTTSVVICKNVVSISESLIDYFTCCIAHSLNIEQLIPTHRSVVGCECLESLYILKKRNLIEIEDDIFYAYMDTRLGQDFRKTAICIKIRMCANDEKILKQLIMTILQDRTLQIFFIKELTRHCPFTNDAIHKVNTVSTATEMWRFLLDCVDQTDEVFSLADKLFVKMYGRRPKIMGIQPKVILTAADHQYRTIFES